MRKLRLGEVKSLAKSIPCSKWSMLRYACGSVYLIPMSVYPIPITLSSLSSESSLRNEVIKGKLWLWGPALYSVPGVDTHSISFTPYQYSRPVSQPLFTGKKTGAQWVWPDEPPFLAPVMSGPCIPRSGESDPRA